MLKPGLRRVRMFMGAELAAELQAIRAENAALRGSLEALRAELTSRDAKENALVKQMEAALLAIALNRCA
ncbi:MAG: hypothetical protein KGK02_09975 [Rhodospirillales bacterium]|nr:hypothetical protein [Rhodospirillales bacterium]